MGQLRPAKRTKQFLKLQHKLRKKQITVLGNIRLDSFHIERAEDRFSNTYPFRMDAMNAASKLSA